MLERKLKRLEESLQHSQRAEGNDAANELSASYAREEALKQKVPLCSGVPSALLTAATLYNAPYSTPYSALYAALCSVLCCAPYSALCMLLSIVLPTVLPIVLCMLLCIPIDPRIKSPTSASPAALEPNASDPSADPCSSALSAMLFQSQRSKASRGGGLSPQLQRTLQSICSGNSESAHTNQREPAGSDTGCAQHCCC